MAITFFFFLIIEFLWVSIFFYTKNGGAIRTRSTFNLITSFNKGLNIILVQYKSAFLRYPILYRKQLKVFRNGLIWSESNLILSTLFCRNKLETNTVVFLKK